MSAADVHVLPLEHGWELRRDGYKYPTSRHATQRSAIRLARQLADESGSKVIVHHIDGQIRLESEITTDP